MYMSLVYQMGMIIPGLEILDCFFIVFTTLSETFNGGVSGVVFDGILNLDYIASRHL